MTNMADMAKNLSEEREALYQMICSLKDEDIQKVVSYVSFLRFVDVYKDKAMADLLKIELTKGDLPNTALDDSPHDTVNEYLSPSLELPYENDPVPGIMKPEAVEPETAKLDSEPPKTLDVEPVIEPFIEDMPRYKKLKEELLHKAEDISFFHKAEDEPSRQILEEPSLFSDFADGPLRAEPEDDVPAREPDKDFLDNKFYEPLGNEVTYAEEASAARTPPSSFEDDIMFYAPVRSDYFDSHKKPKSVALPEPDDYAQPLPEPVETLPLETPLRETPPPDELVPETVQPETDHRDSDTAEEPLSQETTPPHNPHRESLRRVIKSLRLNFADVAFLFQVSLPVARTLFADAMLGAEEELQLQYFLETAERLEEMNIPRLDQIIRYPMPDGEFFLEKLKDREITDEVLKTLLETAEKFEELRHKFKGATKPFHVMQDAIGLYTTPLYCEV